MSNYHNLLKQSYLSIKSLKAKLHQLQQEKHEPIAIIGMGCRVPGAENLDDYWTILSEGKDQISEVP